MDLMSALRQSQMQTVLLNSTGGGEQEPGSKGEKTPSVVPGGILKAGLPCNRLHHVLVGFSAGWICLVHSSSVCIVCYKNVTILKPKATWQNTEEDVLLVQLCCPTNFYTLVYRNSFTEITF